MDTFDELRTIPRADYIAMFATIGLAAEDLAAIECSPTEVVATLYVRTESGGVRLDEDTGDPVVCVVRIEVEP